MLHFSYIQDSLNRVDAVGVEIKESLNTRKSSMEPDKGFSKMRLTHPMVA